MAKKVTHEVVRYMGDAKGKSQWKNCGKVVHDDETGKDVLWINPAAMRSAIHGHNTDDGVPFLMFPKTGKTLGREPVAQPQEKAANPPFDSAAPGGYAATPAKYTEPPIDFDDDIPF